MPPGEWIVTEKIHGANFSVVADGTGTRFTKRSGELPELEDFYGFRSAGLDATLSACAHRLLDTLRRTDAFDSVCVFGELCGGHYPHREVPVVPGALPVQCSPIAVSVFPFCASRCLGFFAVLPSIRPKSAARLLERCPGNPLKILKQKHTSSGARVGTARTRLKCRGASAQQEHAAPGGGT